MSEPTEPTRTQPRGAVRPPTSTPIQSRETDVGTRRVRRLRPYAAVLFITGGVGIWFVELVLNWLRARPLNGGSIALGSIVAFIGFYLIDHADAKDAGAFVFDKTITLIKTVRGGRATDPSGTVVVETTVAKPAEEAK